MASDTGPSKGWIIFWLVAFWPIGLYLLLRRSNSDKNAIFSTGRSLLTGSYVLAGLTILMALAAAGAVGASSSTSGGGSDNGSAAAAAVLFGVGAVVLGWLGRRFAARATRYKSYISLVVNHRETSLDAIATAIAAPIDVVIPELQRMVREDYLPGGHLDLSQRKILMPSSAPATTFTGLPTEVATAPTTCRGCGATNRTEVGGACEYCGTPL